MIGFLDRWKWCWFEWEKDLVEELNLHVNNIQIHDGDCDTWWGDHDPSGMYSVISSAYKALMSFTIGHKSKRFFLLFGIYKFHLRLLILCGG